MSKPKSISVSEYAKIAKNPRTGDKGVSVQTIYRWIESGKIKGEKLSGIQFVIVEDNA